MSVDSFQEQQDNSSICEQSKLKRKTFRQKKQEKIIKEAKKMYEIENQERKIFLETKNQYSQRNHFLNMILIRFELKDKIF